MTVIDKFILFHRFEIISVTELIWPPHFSYRYDDVSEWMWFNDMTSKQMGEFVSTVDINQYFTCMF